jgi:hypothetical protein
VNQSTPGTLTCSPITELTFVEEMAPKYEYRTFFPRPDEGTDPEYEHALEALIHLREIDKVEENRIDKYYVTSQPHFGVKHRDESKLELKYCTTKLGSIELWTKEEIHEAPFTKACLKTIVGQFFKSNVFASTSELNVANAVDLKKSVYKDKVDVGNDKKVGFEVTTITAPSGKQWVTVNVEHKDPQRIKTFLGLPLAQSNALRDATAAAKGAHLTCSYPAFAFHVFNFPEA